jgi:hypothetical protein
VPSAFDPRDVETSLALTMLAQEGAGGAVVQGAFTHEDHARRVFTVVLSRYAQAPMLALLDSVPGAEALTREWRKLPPGWAVRVVVDGRPSEAEWPPPKRLEGTWEDRKRRELRRHGVYGVVRLVAPGMVREVRATKQESHRTLRVTVAWEDELTSEQGEVLRRSIEWWLQLAARDGWTVSVFRA